ncbi:hypothetical protein BLA17378_02164 [Burkholderia aenigmatica]|uniref:Uncharacterized protein n=1 Tax=Burkholderia aenigmatica TaxID=2015348 RepID=A0ABY6XNS0_9BURK|nr:hypothetical protein BLA17378_02164 [Burkholderia aenigmatica]
MFVGGKIRYKVLLMPTGRKRGWVWPAWAKVTQQAK